MFAGLEITNAIIAWKGGKPYVISSQIIIVFTSLLGHHLGLLFNKRKEYNPNTESIDKKPAVTEDVKKSKVKEEDKG